MKKIFLFLLLIAPLLHAQEEKTKFQKEYDLKKIGLIDGFLLSEKQDLTPNKLQENNYVTVAQIGNLNFSAIDVMSKNNQIEVNQIGKSNYTDIDKTAKEIKETVFQSGNNNYILDSNYYSNQKINQQFSQQGNGLSLYNYGSNSISNTMSIQQTGNQKSIIVINR